MEEVVSGRAGSGPRQLVSMGQNNYCYPGLTKWHSMGDLQSQGAAGCNSHCFSENSNRSRTDLFDDWSSLHSQFVTFSYDKVSSDSTS